MWASTLGGLHSLSRDGQLRTIGITVACFLTNNNTSADDLWIIRMWLIVMGRVCYWKISYISCRRFIVFIETMQLWLTVQCQTSRYILMYNVTLLLFW